MSLSCCRSVAGNSARLEVCLPPQIRPPINGILTSRYAALNIGEAEWIDGTHMRHREMSGSAAVILVAVLMLLTARGNEW
jgi:hypothetical protein